MHIHIYIYHGYCNVTLWTDLIVTFSSRKGNMFMRTDWQTVQQTDRQKYRRTDQKTDNETDRQTDREMYTTYILRYTWSILHRLCHTSAKASCH